MKIISRYGLLLSFFITVAPLYAYNLKIINTTPYDLNISFSFIAASDLQAVIPAGTTQVLNKQGAPLINGIQVATVKPLNFRPNTNVVVDSLPLGESTISLLGGQKSVSLNSAMPMRLGRSGQFINDVPPSEVLQSRALAGSVDYGLGQSIYTVFMVALSFAVRSDGQFDQNLVIERFLS